MTSHTPKGYSASLETLCNITFLREAICCTSFDIYVTFCRVNGAIITEGGEAGGMRRGTLMTTLAGAATIAHPTAGASTDDDGDEPEPVDLGDGHESDPSSTAVSGGSVDADSC